MDTHFDRLYQCDVMKKATLAVFSFKQPTKEWMGFFSFFLNLFFFFFFFVIQPISSTTDELNYIVIDTEYIIQQLTSRFLEK